VASSTVEISLIARSPGALEDAAAVVAKGLRAGDRIALFGDLGAGKTVFVRGLARGLGHPDVREVVSPTFAIHNRYAGGRLPIDHLDLYRLPPPVSLAREGLDTVLADGSAVLALEWAERLDRPLPGLVLEVAIALQGEGTRQVTLKAAPGEAARLLGGLRGAGG
jgi:tRNA threonylcarbamoyladenosine biosynthesis protein TsaE